MIYLAGSCSSEKRTLMTKIAECLRAAGHKVYCPFELQIENAWDYSQEEWAQKVFDADKNAIENCDLFLMISPGRVSTAGTNWEQGYAYGLKKRTVVIQLGEEPTSLMTYCGCDKFYNMKEINHSELLAIVHAEDIGAYYPKGKCLTVLT